MKTKSKNFWGKRNPWHRLAFLSKRIKELERVENPTKKELRLLTRYRLEFAKLIVIV